MPTTETYNIVREPVILAGMRDSATAELSLLDTFARASDIRELRGTPTHVLAQLRLLEAILLRALETDEGLDVDASPLVRWTELWNSETLPMGAITAYLEEFQDRFDLLDNRAPFMQVASLRTAKADGPDGVGLGRLVPDSAEGNLFSMRRSEGLSRLSFAEAARELVHTHAYAVAGIYPSGVDDTGLDPRAKNRKVYPHGTGPAGDLGGVMIEGSNLRETLLLNLVLGKTPDEPFDYADADDEPVWERDPLTVAEEERIPAGPRGQADLFTWQSRRIRLLHDGDGVTGAFVCYGDQVKPQNLHTVETMSGYRYSENQSKSAGSTVYMPVRHQTSKALWRGLAALLPQEASTTNTVLPPGTIRWLKSLSDRGVLGGNLVLRTRAIGVEYGTQSSVISEIYGDAVDMRVALLQERHQGLARVAIEMVSRTDDAVRALGWLAENLVFAAGGDPLEAGKAAREAEKANGYALVDGEYRSWLRDLGPETTVDAARVRWMKKARPILRHHAQRMIANAGTPAWAGRARGPNNDEVINAPKAFLWFSRQLNKALPSPNDQGRIESEESPRERESA